MAKPHSKTDSLSEAARAAEDLLSLLERIETDGTADAAPSGDRDRFVAAAGRLAAQLHRIRQRISPLRLGSVGISLGRTDGIAKFFAFSFVNQPKRPMTELLSRPFYGSGVYAIYYHGHTHAAYAPLSGTETPIYAGKADPTDPYAECLEEQGQTLHARLKEHAKNIAKTDLRLEDFFFRASPIQSGMQSAVEEFMIRLFRPIWNKEVKICFGIGKHGDSAATRANKRSPWDTMHPGRKWADQTAENQMARSVVEAKIASHFERFPAIPDTPSLYRLLSLE